MKRKDIKTVVKEFFFVNPTAKLRVRELERKLKIPLPSVIRYCKELEAEGILTSIKTGSVVFHCADRSNPAYILEKRLFNIKSLYVSGLIEKLRTELSNPPVILFGSYAKGEDIEKSDIDLYIETQSKSLIDLASFEKRLNRKIQLFRHRKLDEIGNSLLKNNIINGIVLNNQVEVFR